MFYVLAQFLNKRWNDGDIWPSAPSGAKYR